MKAKLIKTENGYGLKDCELIAFVSSRRPEHKHHKLSLKNCQAIERGYDLDELFQREIDELMFTGNLEDPSEYRSGMYKGVKIFLELMGDKKFTEEDLDNAFELGKYVEREDCTENYLAYKQSFQQNEWEVEIVMEQAPNMNYKPTFGGGSDSHYNPMYVSQPKLDADGCLILKTFKSE